MQDRYAGDIGDFGKFGLLRHLISDKEDPPLGVVWYCYVPHDENTNDGRHTSFYTDDALTGCDKELATALQRSVLLKEERSIAALESANFLPAQTKYFREDTNFYALFPDQTQKNKAARLIARDRWLEKALRAVEGCQMVFLDPDNGLEIASCAKKSHKKAGKFAYLDEVKAFKQRAPVVVVYHHLNMGSPHELQINKGVARLADLFQGTISVFALRFRPYSPRAFFILCSPEADEKVTAQLRKFEEGPWAHYWDNFNSLHANKVQTTKAEAVLPL